MSEDLYGWTGKHMTCSHSATIPGVEGDWCPECGKVVKPSVSKLQSTLTEIQTCLDSPLLQFDSVSVSSDDTTAYGNPTPDLHQAVYEVPSHGKRYYRYVVTQGHRIVQSLHIPGGSIDNPRAKQRAARVRSWIAAGMQPEAIVRFIKKW